MEILFLTKLYEPHVGGVERHIREVARYLSKDNRLTVITEKFDKTLKSKEIIDNIKVIRFVYPRIKFIGILFIWMWFFRNRKLISDTDIIHIHDVFIWYLPFRFLFPKKPVYITFHGYSSYPLKRIEIFFQKIAQRLTNGNICIGNYIKKWFGTKPNKISYGAVDLKKFNQKILKIFKYDAIFSSRLDEQTGILIYLDALEILRTKGIKFELVVLGDGRYREEEKRYAIAKGFVVDPSPYFKKSRYAFVSRYLAILEAFANKKLVFAVYDNPLKEDYLKMTPFVKWIIIEEDPQKLAIKIEYYMRNPEISKEMIDQAYRWVRNQTWKKMAGEYLSLWGMKTI